MKRQEGFSLIEVLSTIALMAILMTLGAFALRQYWFQRALYGEQDEVVTQLRSLQEKVTAESNPLVYGAKLVKNSATWEVVQYDPERATGFECRSLRTIQMDAGVEVRKAKFATVAGPSSDCSSQLGGKQREYIFFFSRGTSTEGGVTIIQPNRDGRRLSVCVNGVTGRVTKADGDADCSGSDVEAEQP